MLSSTRSGTASSRFTCKTYLQNRSSCRLPHRTSTTPVVYCAAASEPSRSFTIILSLGYVGLFPCIHRQTTTTCPEEAETTRARASSAGGAGMGGAGRTRAGGARARGAGQGDVARSPRSRTIYARPYNLDARGFYFSTIDEFIEKSAALRDSFGAPVDRSGRRVRRRGRAPPRAGRVDGRWASHWVRLVESVGRVRIGFVWRRPRLDASGGH